MSDGFARLTVAPWAGSPGLQLGAADGDIAVTELAVDIGLSADEVHRRAIAAGVEIVAELEDKPWARREFGFALPEGHRFRVIGPSRPPSSADDHADSAL